MHTVLKEAETAPLRGEIKQLAPKRYPWVLNPIVDFLFVCGGGVFVLLAINYFVIGQLVPSSLDSGVEKWLLILTLLGQHLFADSHNTATYLRIWGSEEDQARFKFYRTWLAYSCIPLFIAGLYSVKFTGFMVYLYLTVVIWHYAAQSFGISLIYCYKRNYFFTPRERFIFKSFIISMSIAVMLRFVSFQEFSPVTWFGVPMPFFGPFPAALYATALGVSATLGAAFLFIVVRKFVREGKVFPWPSALTIATVVALGMSLGSANALMWFYVPAFFHGSQYIAVCLAYYLKERGLPEGVTPAEIGREVLTTAGFKYLATAVMLGCFFYIAIPHVFTQLGFDFALVAGLVLAVVNYHHFITDAAIWRLRDPRCRELLL